MNSYGFDLIYTFAGSHWKKISLFFILLLFLSVFRILSIPFNNDVTAMLPDNPVIQRQLDFLRNSDMAGTIAFSIRLKDAADKSLDLANSMDSVKKPTNSKDSGKKPLHPKDAESKSLHPNGAGGKLLLMERSRTFGNEFTLLPSITKVVDGIEQVDIEKARHQLVSMLPLLLPQSRYEFSNPLNSEEEINIRLKQIYIALTTPGSGFIKGGMRTDPLGWSSLFLEEINRMAGTMGYRVKLFNGRFIDADGNHALLVARTSVPVTDSKGSREMMDAISSLIHTFSDLDITMISGHAHAVSNEDVIKKDIRLAVLLVTISFTLLMFFVFRSPEALLIFLSPFAAIAISVCVASFMYQELSVFMLGFAAVIAGISVDYGIHAYTAFKAGGYNVLRQTGKRIFMASITTIGVFVSFYASSVQDYWELATFSIISILICVLIYLFLIPHLWKTVDGNGCTPASLNFLSPSSFFPSISSFWVISIWIVVLIISSLFSMKLQFTTDIASFDGSSEEVLQAEERFQNVWREENSLGLLF
ncbi:membrane hypothetical protein [Desulfamplus magnetovallimortis]|uniref:Membrane transport protein MMPL domain-containing protein n=1 Tax=Desulfamplus magnetovallimortis TaxID=1246637 RepID=L0R5G9_9BACT|nr:MMPL family transporter [Desulfamplus magnetovallimortis]CCO06770.1 membrane hypothetical protein [Desulfamplus magnetovallimortis BW-1]SLM32821.1 membrane hypothetical protein [Desulfamplus magnetovallimortis]